MSQIRSLIQQLQTLTEDLLYPSESDYPFKVIYWEGENITPSQLRHQFCYKTDTPVRVDTIDDLFYPCAIPQDWHNEAEQAEVKRYQQLLEFMQNNLEDVQVYRVGEREINIYIIGKVSGYILGLSTQAIET